MSTAINSPTDCLMKKVFSLLFILLNPISTLWCCELQRDTVSLSGPVTGLLKELDLLNSPKLKAISLFHPVGDVKIEKLGGGLFLAQKTLDKFKDSTFYFDESRELSERLKKIKNKTEVITRSETPFVITKWSLEKLKDNLIGCEMKIKSLENWIEAEEKWHKLQPASKETIFFFLGAITLDRWPEYLIVRDGFVLSFIQNKKVKTFESDLAYVRWGEKWKKSLKGERLIGIAEAESARVEKLASGIFNFYYPGALTPGIYQIKFMRYLREMWP